MTSRRDVKDGVETQSRWRWMEFPDKGDSKSTGDVRSFLQSNPTRQIRKESGDSWTSRACVIIHLARVQPEESRRRGFKCVTRLVEGENDWKSQGGTCSCHDHEIQRHWHITVKHALVDVGPAEGGTTQTGGQFVDPTICFFRSCTPKTQ